MTVSKALTQLAGAGLIERRRKAGSFVTRPHSQSAVLEIPDVEAEVAALGLPYRFDDRRAPKRRATRADRARFAVAADAWVLALDLPPRRRAAAVLPRGAADQPLRGARRRRRAVRRAVARRLAGAARAVDARRASHQRRRRARRIARALNVAEGAPCLVVERRTWSGETPVTQVRLTYPGEAHELVARFTPGQS